MDVTYGTVKVFVIERNDVIKRHRNVITIWRTSAIEVTVLFKIIYVQKWKVCKKKKKKKKKKKNRICHGFKGYIEKSVPRDHSLTSWQASWCQTVKDPYNPSLTITVWHHSASIVMPTSHHRDGFFYLPLASMIDPSNPSFAITVWHHTANLMMPDSDPQDGFFYLPLTSMIDPSNPSLAVTVWHHTANLMMPDSDPQDGFFYLPLTSMIAPSNPSHAVTVWHHTQTSWCQTVILMTDFSIYPSHQW